MTQQINKEKATDAVLVEGNPGKFLNLDEKFKWKENLNPRQKRFVYFEATIPENTKGKTILCTKKAGYEESMVKSMGYKMLKQEKVLREIENIKGQLALEDCEGSKSSEKEKQPVLDTVYVELEDEPGKFLDLNKAFEWRTPLSPKHKRFAFFYSKMCLANNVKGNKVKIAIKSGFSESFAEKNVYQLLQDPDMVEAIQSIMHQLQKKDLNEYIEEKEEDAEDSLYVETEDGQIIDLNTFDWDEGITRKQKKFIFYYIFPFPNSIRSNGPACAVKAGYKPSSAFLASWRLLREPKIISQIKKLKAQIKENTSGKDLKEFLTASVKDLVARKRKILDMSPLDLYDFVSVVDENGIEETRAKAKLPDEIPESIKPLIEDIQYVGKNCNVRFSLSSRSKAEAAIISFYKDLCCKQPEKDSEEFDVEATNEMLQTFAHSQEIIARNKKLLKLAGFESEENEGEEKK